MELHFFTCCWFQNIIHKKEVPILIVHCVDLHFKLLNFYAKFLIIHKCGRNHPVFNEVTNNQDGFYMRSVRGSGFIRGHIHVIFYKNI